MSTLNIDPVQNSRSGEYALANGEGAVRRLLLLHKVYGRAGRHVLVRAGLRPGMHIAEFGCGIGAATRTLAEMTGPSGTVTAIDISTAQLEQAAAICRGDGLRNVRFLAADACATGLPDESFDLAYCRFLLLHLTDPMACLREMRRVLKPGGILVVEDGDLATATSVPPTALDSFAELFSRLGPMRGVNYSLANNLYHMVTDAGFPEARIEIHQPAGCGGDHGRLLTWSVAEAGDAFVGAGLISRNELNLRVCEMEAAANDPGVLALTPRVSIVWACKPGRARGYLQQTYQLTTGAPADPAF
jgi:ubiquinone/menaquinone biosynthesis C-methylase UbiE